MRHSIAVHPLHSELNSTGHALLLAHGRLNKLGILAVKFHVIRPGVKNYSTLRKSRVFFSPPFILLAAQFLTS